MPILPRLKRVRDEAALSQEQLSRLSGVAKPTIVRLEHGYNAKPSTVRKLADALNVEPRELMGQE